MLRPVVLAFVLCAVAAIALPGDARAGYAVSAELSIDGSCVEGTGPSRADVVVTLRSPDGHLRDRIATRAYRDGWWEGCFEALSDVRTYINGGDRLRINVGGTVLKAVVPRMAPVIDRVRNTIDGRAPAHTDLIVAVDHRDSFECCSSGFEWSIRADGSGSYHLDTTSIIDLRGADVVYVSLERGGITFWASRQVPYIHLGHATNRVRGSANPGTLQIVLRNADGAVKASKTHTGLQSGFSFQLSADDGTAAYPVAGDWLDSNLASDAHLAVPKSALAGDPATDIVRGQCMPNAPYELDVRWRSFYGTSDARGRLERHLGSKMNVRFGDRLLLTCMYPSGDLWQRAAVAL